MYGDTLVMRRRAAQLREQGEDIRAMAEQLVTRSDEIAWSGRAADAMRERVRDRATHLREAANAHDTAAASLEKHLHECDRLTESISGIERRASSLAADARTRIARIESSQGDQDDPAAVRATPTREDRALAGFTPPPAGHKDWLSVELPGL
jgi:chromosome segregation ATPase